MVAGCQVPEVKVPPFAGIQLDQQVHPIPVALPYGFSAGLRALKFAVLQGQDSHSVTKTWRYCQSCCQLPPACNWQFRPTLDTKKTGNPFFIRIPGLYRITPEVLAEGLSNNYDNMLYLFN